MASKDKDKSLLEIAIELLQKKQGKCKLSTIIEQVMEIKGYKVHAAKEHTAQFLLDFMQSGYFVYCGDDEWDLKERQSTSVIDKDGGDYDSDHDKEAEYKKYELKDDNVYDEDYDDIDEEDEDENDEDEDDDIARELNGLDEDDDLSKEFETEVYDEEDEEEE